MKENMTTPRVKEASTLDAIRKHLEKYSGKLSHYEQEHLKNPGMLFCFNDIVRRDTSPEPTTDNLEQTESNLEKHIKETKEEHIKIIGPHYTNQAIEKLLLKPKFNKESSSRYAHVKSDDENGNVEQSAWVAPVEQATLTSQEKGYGKSGSVGISQIRQNSKNRQVIQSNYGTRGVGNESQSGYLTRGGGSKSQGKYRTRGSEYEYQGGYGPHIVYDARGGYGPRGAYNARGGSGPHGSYNAQGGFGSQEGYGSQTDIRADMDLKPKRGHGLKTGKGKQAAKYSKQ